MLVLLVNSCLKFTIFDLLKWELMLEEILTEIGTIRNFFSEIGSNQIGTGFSLGFSFPPSFLRISFLIKNAQKLLNFSSHVLYGRYFDEKKDFFSFFIIIKKILMYIYSFLFIFYYFFVAKTSKRERGKNFI